MQPQLDEQFARIIGLQDSVQPAEFTLDGTSCTLGRASTCEIIVQRPLVSRRHARIERDGPRYMLVDAGSVNGTFVNNRMIQAPHLLADRDLIGLGDAVPVLRFIDPDPTQRAKSSRLRYDEPAMAFMFNGQRVELTPAQLRLLLHLYRNAGRVCTRESCAEVIWGRAYDPGMDADALDRAISNLRGRLRQLDDKTEFITSRRGLGYELTV